MGIARLALAAATTALLACTSATAAVVDYFLKIDGIEGESVDDRHKGQIEVLSWSWGVTQATGGSGGGRASGKACPADIAFTKYVDRATPVLIGGTVTGQAYATATLVARKAGKEQQEFLKIELKNVMITSYQTGGSSGAETPTDAFALRFGSMKVEYRPQKPDGSLDSPVVATFQAGNC